MQAIRVSDQVRLSIIRKAIANSRKPTAPRQKPTGSSRKARWENAVNVPTVNASAASPIRNQQTFRMARIIDVEG